MHQNDNVLLCQLSVNALSSSIAGSSSLSVDRMSLHCNLSLCVHPPPPPPRSFCVPLLALHLPLRLDTCVGVQILWKRDPLCWWVYIRGRVGSQTVEWGEAERENLNTVSHSLNEPPALMTLCKMVNLWVGSGTIVMKRRKSTAVRRRYFFSKSWGGVQKGEEKSLR